jgi:hypothetical protein
VTAITSNKLDEFFNLRLPRDFEACNPLRWRMVTVGLRTVRLTGTAVQPTVGDGYGFTVHRPSNHVSREPTGTGTAVVRGTVSDGFITVIIVVE